MRSRALLFLAKKLSLFKIKGGSAMSPGGTGQMRFDDIRLYPDRCVPSIAKPQYDLSGNCVVDYDDIVILTERWLDSGLITTPGDRQHSSNVIHAPTLYGISLRAIQLRNRVGRWLRGF
jgi:hypothetical protein